MRTRSKLTDIRTVDEHDDAVDARFVPAGRSDRRVRDVSTAILDLDHTLWDWTRGWASATRAMLGILTASVDPALALQSFRASHLRHGTTDCAAALEELTHAAPLPRRVNRRTHAIDAIAALAREGTLGDLYAASLTFHNAYGPDREWFYDPARSGGGCLMDLGSHLVDLALAFLPGRVTHVESRLFRHGARLTPPLDVTEDFATVRCDFSSGATADLRCSWRLPAGNDCVVECTWYGTKGGATMTNVGGSFYDFVAERLDGTRRTRVAEPPDDWGGRTIVESVARLAAGEAFDRSVAARLQAVADVMDAAYGRTIVPAAAATRAQEVA